jgi:phosphosulfolactate synthase
VDDMYWTEWLHRSLPERVAKPRIAGLTMVSDEGVTASAMRDVLQLAADYIDFWTFSSASVVICPPERLMDKVSLCQEYGVLACPSGASFATAYACGQWEAYVQSVADNGLRVLVIADVDGHLPVRVRREAIRRAHGMGLMALTQFRPFAGGAHMCTGLDIARQVHNDLNAGADYVLLPLPTPVGLDGEAEVWWARERRMLTALWDEMGPLQNRLILQTPSRFLHLRLLEAFGSKLNLADVRPQDVVSLEGARRGLPPEYPLLAQQELLATPVDGEHERAVNQEDDEQGTQQVPTSGPVIWVEGGSRMAAKRRRGS